VNIAAWVVRRRHWVLAGWVIVLVALAPAAARVQEVLDVSAHVEGSESAFVDAVLRDRFDAAFARHAVLVLTGSPDPASAAGGQALRDIIVAVSAVPGVTGTLSWLDAADPLFRSADGSATFVIAGIEPAGSSPDALVLPLRAATRDATVRLREQYPEIALRWTGDVMLNHDIRRTSAHEGERAEARALPLTLAMLLVAFGTVVAAFIPVMAGMAGILCALGAAALISGWYPLSILLANIVTMIGLGLGIDYALLTVSRFREELAAGRPAHEAAAHAGRAAGHTVLLSGAAVLIGFLALALVPLNELRAVAIGGAVVVAFSVAVAITLVPALLAMLGDRVNAGRLLRRAPSGAASERWRAWGRFVTAHPVLVLVVAGAPMLLLAAQVLRIETGLPRSDWLPPSMESAQALNDLDAMGREGVVQALRIVLELPAGTSAVQGDGWRATARLGAALAADERVERVQALPLLVRSAEPDAALLALVPPAAMRSFVSRDERLAVLELMPRSGIDFPSLTTLAREVRALDVPAITGLAGATLHVGGMPAFNADYEDAIAGRFGLVVALVLGGTLLALLAGFRSVLIPLKALFLNVLSVAAALGVVVLVFQDGHGAALVGLSEGMGSLFPALPVLVFCIVFGLSMDYEVFLVARVAEARRAGLDESEAIAEGLARTGGVITSAAAIMIVVFGAFMLGDFLMIKVLGFALAVAVLFDATVVRIAIGPALLRLAGKWNWWPGSSLPDPARPRTGTALEPGVPTPTGAQHVLR
jgi:putative drug exporter of the RND superfamily